jgi:hypothetical protein
MRQLLVAGIAVAAFYGTAAVAADMPVKAPVAPAPVAISGFFGEITGAYDFADPLKNWQEFGLGAGPPAWSNAGVGSGWNGRALVGYRWGTWDVAVAGEYGKFRDGDVSTSGVPAFTRGTLSAKMQAYDGQVGYHTMFGSTDARLALGIRYAKWDNSVASSNPATISHNWSGVGPRGEISTKTPLTPSLFLRANGGLGVLFGKIKTSSVGSWNCSQCNDENATSLNVDGSLGVGYTIAPGADLIVGWKAEYWSAVNVAMTDNSGAGLNQGHSGVLSQGPFVTLKFGPSP